MMKNIAIMTDIHGNAAALRAVLEAINKRGDIDHIVCLGDMIAIGHETNEVLELLFSRKNISFVTGNHDEAVLALAKGEAYPESHNVGQLKRHHEWICNNIKPAFIEKLSNLPRYIKMTVEGVSLMFVHYHVTEEKRNEHISEDPFSPIVSPTKQNITELFQDYHEEIICFGHHHPVHCIQTEHKTFFNPGSLGCNDKPIAKYGIIQLYDRNHSLFLEEVSYDWAEYMSKFETLKVPDSKAILSIFYGQKQ